MLISRILAWLSVLFCVMTALRFVARVAKIKPLNRFFHKIHIPFGVLLLIAAGVHGILAGNPAGISFWEIEPASMLFTLNWGTAAYLCAVLLGVSYLLRKKLRKKWMIAHRILTVLMLVTLILHLFEMGIELPAMLSKRPSPETVVTTPSTQPTTAPTTAATQGGEAADDTTQSTTESVTESAASPTTEAAPLVTFSGAALQDGVYTGSAEGYHDLIYVAVTVSGGQVTDITVTEHSEKSNYFSRAIAVIDAILSGQSLEVDAVSGATYSSVGIRRAVYSALQQAVVSGTLQVYEIDL